MGLKFTIVASLFQILLIILFSVLVDYSDHALPAHRRKGAAPNATETLTSNDIAAFYPSKLICAFFSCAMASENKLHKRKALSILPVWERSCFTSLSISMARSRGEAGGEAGCKSVPGKFCVLAVGFRGVCISPFAKRLLSEKRLSWDVNSKAFWRKKINCMSCLPASTWRSATVFVTRCLDGITNFMCTVAFVCLSPRILLYIHSFFPYLLTNCLSTINCNWLSTDAKW